MAKKKSKSLSLVAIVFIAVAALGAVLTVIGLLGNWLKYEAKTVLGNSESFVTLKKLAENQADLEKIKSGYEGFGAMNAFAYITMILAIVAAAATVLSKLLGIKLLAPISGLSGLLTLVSTVLLIVFLIVFCSKNGEVAIGNLAKGEYKWAIGAVLTVIGGFLSGAASLVASRK